jgi:hypothetical protein
VRDVFVAPRERLTELHDMAPLIAGHGPTLVLDFEIYADRHFLRAADPEGATDLRYRRVARRDGQLFEELTTAEVDEVATADLWVYRTLVRRRSPIASRPPAAFRLRVVGDAFEAWERDPHAAQPLSHVPLGDARNLATVPKCADVRTLARTPGVRTLAAAARSGPVITDLVQGAAVDVPSAGRWRVWIGGATLGRLTVKVDGRPAGSHRHELAHGGQWLRFDTLELQRGTHRVTFEYERGWAGRGREGAQPALGPLALSPVQEEDDPPVTTVAPADYRRLCDGRRYDWIEALG